MWGGIDQRLQMPYSLTTAVHTPWYHTLGAWKHRLNIQEQESGYYDRLGRGMNSKGIDGKRLRWDLVLVSSVPGAPDFEGFYKGFFGRLYHEWFCTLIAKVLWLESAEPMHVYGGVFSSQPPMLRSCCGTLFSSLTMPARCTWLPSFEPLLYTISVLYGSVSSIIRILFIESSQQMMSGRRSVSAMCVGNW